MARQPQRSSSAFLNGFGGGGRIPPIIGILIVTTFLASVLGAAGGRNGFPLAEKAALVPALVLQGQLWRLFSWVFFEVASPFGLIFACLSLYWFGSDLAHRWGAARFLFAYLGIASAVGAMVTGIAVLYPPLSGAAYLTTWPLQETIIILWASYFPSRQIRLYFVLPVGGRNLILLTVGGTVLFTIFYGIEAFIPHFLAELLALITVFSPSPRMWWMERKLRGMEKRRRATHLRAVPREAQDDEKSEPPGGRWLN